MIVLQENYGAEKMKLFCPFSKTKAKPSYREGTVLKTADGANGATGAITIWPLLWLSILRFSEAAELSKCTFS